MYTNEEVLSVIATHPNGNIEENQFKKKFPELYKEIINLSFPEEFKWTQKLYHYFHNDMDFKLGYCIVCGKSCKFKSFVQGYSQHCSSKCTNKDKNVLLKRENTCFNNYGVTNPSQSQDIQQKKIETCLMLYGKENYTQTQKFKDEYKKWCQLNYNCDNVFQSEEIKEKIKETNLLNHGVEYFVQTDEFKRKSKETCNIKYNNDFFQRTLDFLEKVKQTNLKNCGKEFYSQTQEFKNRYEQTCQEKYNVKNYAQIQECIDKINNTKRLNNSFHVSKIENELKNYLEENNINFIYQYKSKLYPFNCDFYFPENDLYVEIQGSWTHGKHPFNEKNKDDIKILNEWIEKCNKSEYYKNAIEVWTKRDVKKREIARKNNLNYLEIYSIKLSEVINILNKQMKI